MEIPQKISKVVAYIGPEDSVESFDQEKSQNLARKFDLENKIIRYFQSLFFNLTSRANDSVK